MARFTATEAHDLACFRSHSGKADGDTEPGPYSDIGISRYESVGEESDGAVACRWPDSPVSNEALHAVADECGTGV